MGLQERMGSERAWQGKREPHIAEGVDVERAAFGVVRDTFNLEKSGYIPFQQAVAWVKNHQPTLQFRPKIASDLRKEVANLCSDKSTAVRFFTAIGTPLDIYHGVDAFIEQGGHIVTVDISMREKETVKADVLVVASMDNEGQVYVSGQEMRTAAEHIADKLNIPKWRAA